MCAYKADWTHFAAWCAAHGFVCVPAAPATVGAYLASLADSHAPSTIRRRLAALGKMHRFNDLPWNAGQRRHPGPIAGCLAQPRPPGPGQAAALSLAMVRQLLATCDQSRRGRRDRALLLFGFAAALRRSELTSLNVEDVAIVAGGLRLRIRRGKTDQAGQGAEIGLPRGKFPETCPVRAFEAWQAVAKRKAGPLFRRISTGDRIGASALHPDAVRRILAHRIGMAGLSIDGFDRLSAHALRVGFITEAYDKGVRDEDIMRHTRHRDLRTMRGYVRRASLLTESPAGVLDLSDVTDFQDPWEAQNRRRSRCLCCPIQRNGPSRRSSGGRRPVLASYRRQRPLRRRNGSSYHHLTISGPAETVDGLRRGGAWIRRGPLAAGFYRPRRGGFCSRRGAAGESKKSDDRRLPHPGAAVSRAGRGASGPRRGVGWAQ